MRHTKTQAIQETGKYELHLKELSMLKKNSKKNWENLKHDCKNVFFKNHHKNESNERKNKSQRTRKKRFRKKKRQKTKEHFKYNLRFYITFLVYKKS